MVALRHGAFVDTSAWYATVDSADQHHAAAARQWRQIVRQRRRLMTTNYVAGETYTLLRVRLGHSLAHEFLRRLRDSTFVQRVHVPPEWDDEIEAVLRQYADQPFSDVDATSFVTMRRLHLVEAFAFDHHFAIAGFALLAG